MDSSLKTAPPERSGTPFSRSFRRKLLDTSLISLRWRKAWRDLWLNKLRSFLVILSMAIGIFAFGLILGTRNTIVSELPVHYMAVVPASAIVHTSLISDDMVETIERMPEIAVADGRVSVIVRFLNGDGEWHDMQLYALDDYENSQVNVIRPKSGSWPPPDRGILIERNSLYLTGAGLDSELIVETGDGHERALRLEGLVHDMNQLPAQVTGIPYGYVNRDTLDWLGIPRDYNELQLLVAEDQMNKEHNLAVAELVREKLEKAGAYVYWVEVPEPGQHLVEEFMPAIILLMTSLGVLALILSAFLVINVITAVMTQQQRQIGLMKIVGARTPQITSIYLRGVLLLGLAALVLAIPFSALGAREFSQFIAGQFNFDLNQFRPTWSVIALEIIAGLLIPIVAALYPIRQGTRATVREAVQDYGLELEGGHHTPLDMLLMKLPVSRPIHLSLRNTFRRRGRLARTLITLMLGGGIFMSVMTVRASLFNTLEDTLVSQGFDVQLQLARPHRRTSIEQAIAPVPGVAALENWRLQQGILVRTDETDGDGLIVYALPPDTALFQPQMKQGRWLETGDEEAIVVPISLVREEPEVALGEEITVRIAGEEHGWRVVGVLETFQPPIAPPAVYVNQAYFERLVGNYGRADVIRVLVEPSSGLSDVEVRQTIEARLKALGMEIRSTHTISEDRDIFGERFNIITVILLIMSFLMATVGGLGLMGTMSINVLERTREIGVMRAIGASDGAVLRVFLIEGLVIGVMSWFGGIILSQPMSRLISRQLGIAFLQIPLHFEYNWFGPVYWLVIVILISALASLVPAFKAAQLSVRETLAYE